MKFGVGQPVPRNEDPRFLKGRGRYVSDIAPYGQTHGYVLRSPHAHAKIKSIDASKAKTAPGVLLVLTGKDADADKIGILPAAPAVAFGGPLKAFAALHQVLVRERVRHVGDPIAFVVAETLHQARDAQRGDDTVDPRRPGGGAVLVCDERPARHHGPPSLIISHRRHRI